MLVKKHYTPCCIITKLQNEVYYFNLLKTINTIMDKNGISILVNSWPLLLSFRNLALNANTLLRFKPVVSEPLWVNSCIVAYFIAWYYCFMMDNVSLPTEINFFINCSKEKCIFAKICWLRSRWTNKNTFWTLKANNCLIPRYFLVI